MLRLLRTVPLLCGVLLALMLWPVEALARGACDSAKQDSVVEVSELPAEARETILLIRSAGPFPYERDGAAFGNFERALPLRSRGYYREYTVRTPGVRHRGARRIVAGRVGELYYTDDHYRTFKRIRE